MIVCLDVERSQMQRKFFEVSLLIKPPFGFSFSALLVKKSSITNLTCTVIHGHVDLQQLNKRKQ